MSSSGVGGSVVALSQGLLAARPAAATFGVGLYEATDVGMLYRSDGATWTEWLSTPNASAPIPGVYIRKKVGAFSPATAGTNASSFGSIVQFREIAVPCFLPAGTLDRLWFGANNVVAANMRLGLYNDSNGAPGTILVDGGNVAQSALNTLSVTINQVIAAGPYWLACKPDGVNQQVYGVNPIVGMAPNSGLLVNQNALVYYYYDAGGAGPFSSPYVPAGITPATSIPMLGVRYSA